MRPSSICLAIATVCGFVVPASTAGAVVRTITLQAHGAGVCQAALPAYEGAIRKRPLVIQNEGTGNAFVTCSPSNFDAAPNPFGFSVGLANYTSATVTISCTGVDGHVSAVSAVYTTKTATIAANFNDYLDFSFDNDNALSVSCSLPPGTGVDTLYTYQQLDVGD